MKTIEIFEPAMCCATGVCGPSIDPELLRISTLVSSLDKKGVVIKRYNLSNDPGKFVSNKLIGVLLEKDGVDILPVTLVDETIAKTKAYPTNEEISSWAETTIESEQPETKSSCCGGGSCC